MKTKESDHTMAADIYSVKSSGVLILMVLSIYASMAQDAQLTSGVYVTQGNKSTVNVLKGSTTFFESLDVTVVTLQPRDKSHASYTTDLEELVIVKEGKLKVTLGQKTDVFEPGS